MGSLPPEKRRRIAQETLEIFAPIAKRLGMHDLSVELEELSFMAHNPGRYAVFSEAVEEARDERKKVLNLVNKTLQEGLTKANLPSCTSSGKRKTFIQYLSKNATKTSAF